MCVNGPSKTWSWAELPYSVLQGLSAFIPHRTSTPDQGHLRRLIRLQSSCQDEMLGSIPSTRLEGHSGNTLRIWRRYVSGSIPFSRQVPISPCTVHHAFQCNSCRRTQLSNTSGLLQYTKIMNFMFVRITVKDRELLGSLISWKILITSCGV